MNGNWDRASAGQRTPATVQRPARRSATAAALVVLAAAAFAPSNDILAQGYGQTPPQQQRPPAKAQQKRTPTPADAASAAPSDATLRQRIEQLEEQFVDLQVVVGTVESMSRGGPASAAAPYRGAPGGGFVGGSGADAGRIAALETQVQALAAQLEQVTSQLRALQGSAPRGPSGPAPRVGGFGNATVVPPNDPIANIINNPDGRDAPGQRFASAPQGVPSPAGARPLYDQAYALLLQQNYGAAEAGFSDFLQRYPSDELAPNAQFWLGETHFVRGGWDAAAASFLKVAQNYPRSEKAPDSLAKFAMAMERKGNRAGACRALQELNARYPNPPQHVRNWEAAERRRAQCS